MIKFTHSRSNKDLQAVKPNTGIGAFMPTTTPARTLFVSLVLAFFLVITSFCFTILTGLKNNPGTGNHWAGAAHRIANLFGYDQYKQNVNTNLVNLPGGQFIPSLSYPLNILVMGVDSNGKNTQRFTATRSDTMMLVSIDPQNNKAAIISIPRDSRVSIAQGHGEDKINSAHAFGGPQLAVETVRQAFNVPVDRYLVVDEEGFKRLIEEIGPVDVLVEKKMCYADRSAALSINLEPGLNRLDAKQAEGYIRFRHDARGDIGRIERQQWFARQITNKLADPQVLVKLPQLLKIATDCIVTDLSADELMRLVGFACHINPNRIKVATLPGKPDMIHGVSYWLPDLEATAPLLNKLVNTGTYTEPPVDLGSAMAYSPASSSSPSLANDKFTVSIRYPRDCEKEADSLEILLKKAGLVSKGKYRADLSECRHEQIIENSVHSLTLDLEAMHSQLPCLNNWPAVINIDPQCNNDLTIVITPNTKFATLVSAGNISRPQ